MNTVLQKALRIFLLLPAIGFVVAGLRIAVAPEGAVQRLAMPLLDGAARSSQIGDVGAFCMGMGLMMITALRTRKREWFIAPAILLASAAVFRTLAFLFHDAPLLMNMIAVEVVIASSLVLAANKLTEAE